MVHVYVRYNPHNVYRAYLTDTCRLHDQELSLRVSERSSLSQTRLSLLCLCLAHEEPHVPVPLIHSELILVSTAAAVSSILTSHGVVVLRILVGITSREKHAILRHPVCVVILLRRCRHLKLSNNRAITAVLLVKRIGTTRVQGLTCGNVAETDRMSALPVGSAGADALNLPVIV